MKTKTDIANLLGLVLAELDAVDLNKVKVSKKDEDSLDVMIGSLNKSKTALQQLKDELHNQVQQRLVDLGL